MQSNIPQCYDSPHFFDWLEPINEEPEEPVEDMEYLEEQDKIDDYHIQRALLRMELRSLTKGAYKNGI